MWHNRLASLNQLLKRWHGRIKLEFEPNKKGASISLTISWIWVNAKPGVEQSGFLKLFKDVLQRIDLKENPILQEEYQEALESVMRLIKNNSLRTSLGFKDMIDFIKTGYPFA